MTGRPNAADLSRLPPASLPLALADLHRHHAVGAEMEVLLPEADAATSTAGVGPRWGPDRIPDLLHGAGFAAAPRAAPDLRSRVVTRLRTLPDTVGPDMRILVVGLNPSLHAADQGVGFGRPGNRFWPAALAAGLVTVDRDPRRALVDHGLGMTDLVKRATVAASELRADEYREGIRRLGTLTGWLQPGVVCIVGLAGWRAAVDRRAVAGPQDRTLGGRPVYLMPNTSGLNAGTRLEGFVEHLAEAGRIAAEAARGSAAEATITR